MYLKARMTENGKDGSILYPVVHSPNGYSSRGWTKPKPGAWNFIWAS